MNQAQDKIVLIVEDDEPMRELVSYALSREGFRTVTAADGRDGLRAARELSPDLIVLDFNLPELPGCELLLELAASGHGAIPVLAMTARLVPPSLLPELRRETGLRALLLKPFRVAALVAAAHALLGTRKGTLVPAPVPAPSPAVMPQGLPQAP